MIFWNGLPTVPRVTRLEQRWGISLDPHQGTYGILSAFMSISGRMNEARHKELLNDLAELGYDDVTPFQGQWKGVPEKAVQVVGITVSDLVDLGKKYNQASVVYKSPEGRLGLLYL